MLTLFRINDPYRILIVLLVLSAIRLPMIIAGLPITVSELNWLLIGEKLASAGNTMYIDLWDSTGAFASGVYYVLHIVFGKSLMAHRVLAMVLILVQAVIFNSLLISNKAYTENNMLPSLFYVLYTLLVPELLILSPVLMGLTFVLLALSNIFKRIDNFTRDDLFLNMGLYLGIATMFYLPFAIFFVLFIVSLLLYSSAILRRMILLAHGFLLVIGITMGYFYIFDAVGPWWQMAVATWWSIGKFNPLGWDRFFVLMVIPSAITLLAIFRTYGSGRYVNYQSKFQNVMVILLFGSLLVLAIAREVAPYMLLFLVLILAFFVPHYLLLIKKRWKSELAFLLLALLPVISGIGVYNGWFYPANYLQMERLYVVEPNEAHIYQNKKVLVLGNDKSFYKNAKLATPYLNWLLCEQLFNDPDYYSKLMVINRHLSSDMPEVIVDTNGLMRPIFDRLPTLKAQYISQDGYYQLRQTVSN